jgi:hypothetical protein
MNITTVTLWVCSCGFVDRVDGGNSRGPNSCSIDYKDNGMNFHRPKPVLVVVPIP